MKKEVQLTAFSKFAGCGAKVTPAMLDKALCGLVQPYNPNVLSDFNHAEDAGVYKLSDDLAIVQTVDFFPPVCDDPFFFGKIAATNAISDIYAMGGVPITAVSIVSFPEEKLDSSYLTKILEGALDALKESGAALVGGHSIRDEQLTFGLCVVGTVHPKKMWSNNRAQDGDLLLFTKPLGSGILQNAVKAQVAGEGDEERLLKVMSTLNKDAAEIFKQFDVHACTDVTGFGLLGHLSEMAIDNPNGFEIVMKDVPLMEGVRLYAEQGFIPGGSYTNRDHRKHLISNLDELDETGQLLLFDPQTSGGLLAALSAGEAHEALKVMRKTGIEAAIIGRVSKEIEGIVVRV
ncbi:MAG: selenide, water dikinase SelD [Sphaerochaeta sp.]|nr:MAG: selenide, water dikinase SelD [Sphaerochaeta sp.]